MDRALDSLVQYVCDSRDVDVPQHVLNRARDIFVDSIGCALGGLDAPAVKAAKEFADLNDYGQGCVIGSASRQPIDLAAFSNAAMIRYLDYNDAAGGGHPSDMLGAFVSIAGAKPVSGLHFLKSIVVAYEVYIRVKNQIVKQPQLTLDQGYQTSIGATAGLAFLLGLDEQKLRNALSFAATSNVPLRASRAGELSNLKGFATALSLRDVIFYVHLAERGVTAPDAPFEGRHGIVELLTGNPGPFELECFDEWLTMGTLLKYWPVAYRAQMGVVAGLALRDIIGLKDVQHIRLRTSHFLFHESGSEPEKWRPQTRETADHSLPYVFARSFVDGNLTSDDYEIDRIRDPSIVETMGLVSVVPDENIDRLWPDQIAIGVDVTSKTGDTFSMYLDVLPGFHTHPLEMVQLKNKFLSLTTPRLGSEGAEGAFRSAWNIMDCEDVAHVMEQFVLPNPPAN